MASKVQPVFIFSLPRSGSTLLQRILMSHPVVASTAEPWLLFPYSQIIRSDDIYSSYSVDGCSRAINDFFDNSRLSEEQILGSLRKHLLELYDGQMQEDEVIFIDKTPRYYLIINEIAKIFPEAKFIFLFRNPLAIYNSILTTFCNNNFRFSPRYHNDMWQGHKFLNEGFRMHKDRSIAVNYEDLTHNPEKILKTVTSFLNISYDEKMLLNFNKKKFKEGNMGDPTGQFKYAKVENSTQEKWKTNINSVVRKIYFKRYLKSISRDMMDQGYDTDEIINSLRKTNFSLKYTFRDIYGILTCKLILKFKINILLKAKSVFYS